MSTPSVPPGHINPGRPPVFTDYLQHSLGLCQLFESVEAMPPGTRPIPMTHGPRFQFPGVPARPVPPGTIDATRLHKVLDVDSRARLVEVQGWCTMADLVTATSCHGLLPAVVAPFSNQFVADAVAQPTAGAASFRNGLLAETMTSLDVLTGERLLRTAQPEDEFADLFHAFGVSAGRLGLATSVTLRLVPARAFVAARAVRITGASWPAELAAAASGHWRGEDVDLLEVRLGAGDDAFVIAGRFVTGPQARRLAAEHGIAAPTRRLSTAARTGLASAGEVLAGRGRPARHRPPLERADAEFALYRTADFLFRADPARPTRRPLPVPPMAGPYRAGDLAAGCGAAEGVRLYPLPPDKQPRPDPATASRATAPPAPADLLLLADRPVPGAPPPRPDLPSALCERYDPSARFA